MSTILVENDYQIVRQEGDDCDVKITFPAVFPIDGAAIEFSIFRASGANIIKKNTPAITIDGQTATILLASTDTKGHAGKHRWECQVTRDSKVTTIGRGEFIIIKERI